MSFASHPAAMIRFEPDGFTIARPGLAGRQVAGNGFLRAAIAGRGDGPVLGYTALRASAEVFAETVRAIDPQAKPVWITPSGVAKAAAATPMLYTADSNLTAFAKWRLRFGPARYGLCGVTHTISTVAAQRLIGDLISQPVMPWDALVCTSTAARAVAGELLRAQTEHLFWRHGPGATVALPQLPVIPLGVHCEDFAFSADDRARGRQAMGLDDDEVASLYVGRIKSTNKAHPFQLFTALQAAAVRTGRRTALILCGQAPSPQMLEAFVGGAAAFAPDVRLIVVDGRDDQAVRGAWAGGDIFVSLSDSIQETFGLTPLEAMAAGLPVVVSDWNGYRDTVRDGVDGFRIATWAPEPGAVGGEVAMMGETNVLSADGFAWTAASMTSLDQAVLVDRLAALIDDAGLRRTLGAAGRQRAREVFDWRHVFAQYQALWADLDARRRAALASPTEAARLAAAPTAAPDALDPFRVFASYPTARVGAQTMVTLASSDPMVDFETRRSHALFGGIKAPPEAVAAMLAELAAGVRTVETLAAGARIGPTAAASILAALAKMGVVRFTDD